MWIQLSSVETYPLTFLAGFRLVKKKSSTNYEKRNENKGKLTSKLESKVAKPIIEY